MTEPLKMTFEVNRGVEHVFEVWTEDFARWWPGDHTASGEAGVRVVFEARLGGRIFEETAAGVTHDWGEITLWEPPHRLGYRWYLRRDRTDATEVEITFVDHGGTTRVEIEHRGWERLGAQGPDFRSANRASWSGVLPHFVAVCTADAGRRGVPMSRTVVVRYQVHPEAAEENQRLVEQVYAELAAADPGGLSYATYRLADGVTFIHIATLAGETNPLNATAAFARFQERLAERCAQPPAPGEATIVGSYGTRGEPR